MLADKPILIVQDDIYLALDLVAVVEELEGRPVGPAATVAEALTLLDSDHVAAAVIDADLTDCLSPIVMALAERHIPYVIQTSGTLPPEIKVVGLTAPVVIKPIQPLDVVSILAHEVLGSEAS
jgi:hypothetical protein